MITLADVKRCRNVLLDLHYRNRVGHLGGNLSCIDSLVLLHHDIMQSGDRFVLSKGHSAGAYYVTLWSLGVIDEVELATFHKDGTRLPGHPSAKAIPAIEFATGSLGHGLSLAAGLAKSAKLRKQEHRVFCLTSDGEWQEGSTIEALVFAAHHKLDNLTVLIDHNRLQGFGSTTEVASMHPLDDRLAGFPVELRRCNGHSLDTMRQTIGPRGSGAPTVVILDTLKGHGVPDFAGTVRSHYLPPTDQQYAAAKAGPEFRP